MLAIRKEFGRLEDIFSDVVYPVWPVWLAGAIVIASLPYSLPTASVGMNGRRNIAF